MKKIIVCLLAAFCFVSGKINAQDCPKISVSSAASVNEGDMLVFTANVSGGDPNVSPTYNWAISAGIIESGQGTATITVSTNDLGGQTITASVELGGLGLGCMRSGSSTTSIDEVPPQTELHSKANYTTAKSFSDSVTNFAGDFLSEYYVNTNPKAIIFLYPGKTASSAVAIAAMTKNIKAIFARKKLSNYKIVKSGSRTKTSYELWIVPAGGIEPVATPGQ